jgi:DNA-binding CsgD family transcriptional regulator
VQVKVIRRSDQSRHLTQSRPAVCRQYYYFCEKNSGVPHFHVETGPDGRFPVDQAAGLLAMHCMVRGQSPNDYMVMVQAKGDILEGLTERAEKLLEAGHAVNGPFKLTRREEEVLGGVMRSLSNKEIGAALNLSERTVKFHVSSLLAKFRVRGRMELVREAARHCHSAAAIPVALPAASREVRPIAALPQTYTKIPRPPTVVPLAKRQLMA